MSEHPPIHALVYGDSGAGKTTFASTCPTPMRVWLFDALGKATPFRDAFDGSAEETAPDAFGTDVVYLNAGSDSRIVIEPYCDFDPTTSNGWHRFVQRRDAYLRDREWVTAGDKTLVVDSLTFMALAARKYDQYVTNTTAKDPRKWHGAATDLLEETFCVKLLGLPINLVVLAHIDQERDDANGRMIFNPMAPGRLRKQLPGAFGEFYHATVVRNEKGECDYILQTRPDGRFNASSQIKAPDPCWANYDALWGAS